MTAGDCERRNDPGRDRKGKISLLDRFPGRTRNFGIKQGYLCPAGPVISEQYWCKVGNGATPVLPGASPAALYEQAAAHIADDAEGEACATFVVNKLRGWLKAAALATAESA